MFSFAHTNTSLVVSSATAPGGGKAAKTEKHAAAPIYIHANWVDSYRQRNAFICTQGKLYMQTQWGVKL